MSINNVAQIMKKILDLVKQVADSGGPAAEKRLIKAIEENMATAATHGQMADILVKLEAVRESDKTSGAEVIASLKKLEASSNKE